MFNKSVINFSMKTQLFQDRYSLLKFQQKPEEFIVIPLNILV